MSFKPAIKPNNEGEVRLISIADAHLCDFSPPSWKADYRLTIESAVAQVFAFSSKMNVDAVLWPGDIFHLKAATRHSLGYMADVVRMFKSSGLRHLGIPGNHDFKYGSDASFRGQPIELLAESGAITLLDSEGVVFLGDTVSVQVAGAGYSHGLAESTRRIGRRAGVSYLVALGHFLFGPKDGSMFGVPVWSPDYLGSGDPDMFVLGDRHDDQGVQVVGGKTYVACGSLSFIEDRPESTRRPAAAYIVIKPGPSSDVKCLRPKLPPIVELVDVIKKRQEEEESATLASFIDSLNSSTGIDSGPDGIVASLDVPAQVKERIRRYITQAEAM